MEEREALKRQIELLQNLINKHKSIHGDTPFTGTEQSHPEASTSARVRGQSTSVIHPHSSRGRPYYPQSRGSWKKMYSLRNKSPQSSVGHPSASASSSSVHQSVSQSTTHSISLPSHSRGKESNDTSSSEIAQQKKKGHINSKSTDTPRQLGAVVSQDENEKQASSSTGTREQHKTLLRNSQEFQRTTESGPVVLPGKHVGCSSVVPSSVTLKTSASLQSSSQVQVQPSLTSKTTTATKQNIAAATPAVVTAVNSTPALFALSRVVKPPSLNPSSQNSQAPLPTSFLKKSKFTWVKSQDSSSIAGKAVAPTSVLKAGVASGSPLVSKRTPAKKMARKLSTVNVAQKTSKYKWVSSAETQAKTPRKSLSHKALTPAQRILEKGDASKRLKPCAFPSAKLKKGTAGCSSSSPFSSRYRWKAGGQSTSVAVTEGAAVARRRSAFHWTAEKSNKGLKAGLVVSPTLPQRASSISSPGGFKLRSRMKIIRKSASSGSGSERGGGPSPLKYSPRGRIHTFTRSPIGVRRTPSRELVSFGRHKLRRLSPTLSRTNPASSFHRSPASQRVFRTHYKMVTRPAFSTTHIPHYNPALSWRTKRIQSARNFLQSRLRAPHYRHPSSTQQWRGSSMCWIGGSLYRVSANKLSRTASMSINRTGQFSSSQGSHMTPALTRPSSTRHLASRAVQRSLAIIRHARQKKQQKQYCMYYNRFGRCKRGTNCPYIHDPDKVAVCTRFLRGTCKQAAGVCPFSHKVAKEKMPVCSYFLKGICNNSDCPYSHVYVSRNAEVCEDFVRGYCPAGEKCKKKHTLVCPDFSKTGSCPRGSRCKLQHRQRIKRSASSTSTTPAKKTRPKELLKRPCLSVVMPQDPQAAPEMPSLALPSFISLSSSPEEADAPDTPPVDTSQVKGRNMQNST